jgi:hypothetical protein
VAIYSQIQAGQIAGNATGKLIALRQALRDIDDLYAWSSSVAAADLVAAGVPAADAPMILSAIADAHALWVIYTTGQAPATYPQVTGPYPFGASQRAIIGPQGS